MNLCLILFSTADALAGVKVLHGIDKVLEGGSVVLTLKDQDILANGDLNEGIVVVVIVLQFVLMCSKSIPRQWIL